MLIFTLLSINESSLTICRFCFKIHYFNFLNFYLWKTIYLTINVLQIITFRLVPLNTLKSLNSATKSDPFQGVTNVAWWGARVFSNLVNMCCMLLFFLIFYILKGWWSAKLDFTQRSLMLSTTFFWLTDVSIKGIISWSKKYSIVIMSTQLSDKQISTLYSK